MKASDFIKKHFLILFVLLIFISVVSCQNTSFGKNNFGEVDFKEGQKIQLVAGDEIYNLFVSFNENNDFSLKYLPESSEILLGTTVMVKGDQAEISCGELKFSKNINEFNNSFLPKVIYFFFVNTSFEKDKFVFDSVENSIVLTNRVFEKNVVFTVQLSKDKQSQSYKLEIR